MPAPFAVPAPLASAAEPRAQLLMALQRSAGNRAVASLLDGHPVGSLPARASASGAGAELSVAVQRFPAVQRFCHEEGSGPASAAGSEGAAIVSLLGQARDLATRRDRLDLNQARRLLYAAEQMLRQRRDQDTEQRGGFAPTPWRVPLVRVWSMRENLERWQHDHPDEPYAGLAQPGWVEGIGRAIDHLEGLRSRPSGETIVSLLRGLQSGLIAELRRQAAGYPPVVRPVADAGVTVVEGVTEMLVRLAIAVSGVVGSVLEATATLIVKLPEILSAVADLVLEILAASNNPRRARRLVERAVAALRALPGQICQAALEWYDEFITAPEDNQTFMLGGLVGQVLMVIDGVRGVIGLGRAAIGLARGQPARAAGLSSGEAPGGSSGPEALAGARSGESAAAGRSAPGRPSSGRSAVSASESAAQLRVRIVDRLEAFLRGENETLAAAIASRDVAYLQSLGLRPATIRQLLTRQQFAPAYGRAVEQAFARAMNGDSELGTLFEHIGSRPGVAVRSPGRPDFRGRPGTEFEGWLVDLTTGAGREAHFVRYYGEKMLVLTYERPH